MVAWRQGLAGFLEPLARDIGIGCARLDGLLGQIKNDPEISKHLVFNSIVVVAWIDRAVLGQT